MPKQLAEAALDLGSTNICISVFVNKQKIFSSRVQNSLYKYGPDIITRLSRVATDPSLIVVFQKAIISDIQYLISQCQEKLEGFDRFYVAANTVMLHFLLGKDPRALGRHPFTSEITAQDIDTFTKKLSSRLMPVAGVYVPPVLGGYVGADMASVLYYLQCTAKEASYAVVDMGTNAEVAVRCQDRHIVASVAAGPAFGFQGSDLIAGVAKALRSAKIDGDGLVLDPSIGISQAQVRNLQLAKSAVFTGIDTLVKLAGEAIPTVYLAGVFGGLISVDDIRQIKLLPDVLEQVEYCGNAALSGLEEMITRDTTDMGDLLSGKIEFVELANSETFGKHFLTNTFF